MSADVYWLRQIKVSAVYKSIEYPINVHIFLSVLLLTSTFTSTPHFSTDLAKVFRNFRLSGPDKKRKTKTQHHWQTRVIVFFFFLSFVWFAFGATSIFPLFFFIVFLFISLFLPDKQKTLLNKFFLMFTEILTKNILIIPYIFGSFFFHPFCFAQSFFFC